MTKVVVTASKSTVTEAQSEPKKFTHDLGTVGSKDTHKISVNVGAPTQEGKLATSCWCTGAVATGNHVAIEMFSRGDSGTKQTRTVSGFYKDKSRFSIDITYKVK